MMEALQDPGFLAALLAGLAAFATILTIAAPALKGNKLETRLKSVSNRREELRRKSREQLQEKSLRRKDEGMMRNVVDKLDLQSALKDDNLEKALVQAGLRGPRPVSAFYFARFALPFALGLASFLYLKFVNDFDLNFQLQMCVVMFGAAAGFYAPNMYLTNRADKRKASIMKAFPDSLDMMLICVESGMSIEAAFARVGEEVGTASVELAEELGLTTAELSYLQERRQAYINLAERTNHPGIKSVATALVQAEKYGTPMGVALRTMAKENRELRELEAEKKAAALPAKLTVPMIVFFLPVLFIVIGTPAYIQIKENDDAEQNPVARATE
ncbi:type II secretion system F family protein [Hirschia maritima]|uniref:type II secretion system F family protein n=1 Tax=Hirschia maritima TaxID=1121961 RepID=UPI0003644F1C|nr:type II secretion system F family protein [Hirschia maritima]